MAQRELVRRQDRARDGMGARGGGSSRKQPASQSRQHHNRALCSVQHRLTVAVCPMQNLPRAAAARGRGPAAAGWRVVPAGLLRLARTWSCACPLHFAASMPTREHSRKNQHRLHWHASAAPSGGLPRGRRRASAAAPSTAHLALGQRSLVTSSCPSQRARVLCERTGNRAESPGAAATERR